MGAPGPCSLVLPPGGGPPDSLGAPRPLVLPLQPNDSGAPGGPAARKEGRGLGAPLSAWWSPGLQGPSRKHKGPGASGAPEGPREMAVWASISSSHKPAGAPDDAGKDCSGAPGAPLLNGTSGALAAATDNQSVRLRGALVVTGRAGAPWEPSGGPGRASVGPLGGPPDRSWTGCDPGAPRLIKRPRLWALLRGLRGA